MCGADPRTLDAETAARLEKYGDAFRSQLRRSYACDCVERHDLRPGRITLPVLEQDPAEQVMRGVERDCGVRPLGCPYRATRDPFVGRVVRAHRSWKNGHEVRGAALRAGVEAFDLALNAIQVADMRAERAKPPDKPQPQTRVKRRR